MEKTPLAQSFQGSVIEIKMRITGSRNIHVSDDWVTTMHVSNWWLYISDNVLFSLAFWCCSSKSMIFDINFIIIVKNLRWINVCERCSWHAESDPFTNCTAPGSDSLFPVWPISNGSDILRIIPRSLNRMTNFDFNGLLWSWRTFEDYQTSKPTWKCRISSEFPTGENSRPSDPRRMINVIVIMESNQNRPSGGWKSTKNFNCYILARDSVKSSVMKFFKVWSGKCEFPWDILKIWGRLVDGSWEILMFRSDNIEVPIHEESLIKEEFGLNARWSCWGWLWRSDQLDVRTVNFV